MAQEGARWEVSGECPTQRPRVRGRPTPASRQLHPYEHRGGSWRIRCCRAGAPGTSVGSGSNPSLEDTPLEHRSG